MDKDLMKKEHCVFFAIFIFSTLLLTSCASAQCGDCDDKDPCTRDFCEGMNCQHAPQRCYDENSSPLGKTADLSLAERIESSEQNRKLPSILKDAVKATANCDDSNPSTRDSYGENGCVHHPINIPLLAESSNAYSMEILSPVLPGIQVETPKEINDSRIMSENNSNSLSSNVTLAASHLKSCDDNDPCTVDTFNGVSCEHKSKICDDGNPGTNDYCFGGICYNTTLNCDDGDNCTIDSFNGKACVHTPKNCDDQNACTTDTCEKGKCVYRTRNCNDGNPCTNGVCQYLYYPYAAPYYKPYVIPAGSIPSAQSYTIPAGTAITLPWARSVTALNTLEVENSIAYSSAPPLRFVRSLDLEDQAVSGYQTGLSISERAEMIGISWKDASFTLTLIQPNGVALPLQGDNRNVLHLVGLNYNYYFLRSAVKGNWGIEIKPINPGANGAGFSLITGLVKGAAP